MPALTSFVVGLVALAGLLVLLPQDVSWPEAPWLYTGGLLAAVYITCSLVAMRRLDVLPLMLATVGGQLSGAAALDAVVPLPDRPLTAGAVAGALLALCAVALAARRAPQRAVSCG